MTITDSLTYDGLISGEWPRHTETVTVTDGQTLARGAVVGVVTATGNVVACDHTAVDGSQTPFGVMVEAVTASGSTEPGLVYDFGMFDGSKLTFGGTSTLADLKAAMKAVNLYVNTLTVL